MDMALGGPYCCGGGDVDGAESATGGGLKFCTRGHMS